MVAITYYSECYERKGNILHVERSYLNGYKVNIPANLKGLTKNSRAGCIISKADKAAHIRCLTAISFRFLRNRLDFKRALPLHARFSVVDQINLISKMIINFLKQLIPWNWFFFLRRFETKE